LSDDNADAGRIASIVQSDPAITAKLLKAANSAFYGGKMPVETCTKAVVRLGVNMTQKLVLSFAIRELFNSESPLLRKHMQALWKHSTQVAAICYVLARINRKFNPEHAMLAGLIHDIGEVGVLTYLENIPQLANDETQIERVVKLLRGDVGRMILSKWRFQDDLIEIAEDAENWFRDFSPEADYCDLVIVAQLHSYVGTPRIRSLPSIGDLPSLHKLDLGEITPHDSIKILDKASEQLEKAEALLRG
jgi:HD-like signal output (HDOD) protein